MGTASINNNHFKQLRIAHNSFLGCKAADLIRLKKILTV
jgi:hypothetical protein